jgi:acyl carrier protein phosphodiesterase
VNYLAHVFLSGSDSDLMVGNFIADAVRGKQFLNFPERIQRGILLHRQIDAFTDSHPVVAQTKDRLRAQYNKYAPVIADMYYDHFLASNFSQYSDQSLSDFSAKIYTILNAHWEMLPERVKQFLPHMIAHNWLLSYARLSGINQALTGLSRRTTFASGMETAAVELKENYGLYAADFDLFMPELITFSQQWIAENRNPKGNSAV